MPKLYNTMQNVGRAKYLVNFSRDLFIKELEAEGYKYK